MRYKTKKSYWQQDISRWNYAKTVGEGVVLLMVVSYLFYGTVLCAAFLLPYLVWYVKSWKRQFAKRRQQAFQLQFKEAIQYMSAALNVGYSVENAMRETWKDLQLLYKKEEMIVKEFRYMIHQLDMNLTAEKILKEFAGRVEDEDVQLFVNVFSMAKRSGGDMIGIIRNATEQIGDKIEVKREIDTIMTAKRLEFRIMSAIPMGMIAYTKLSFPEFTGVLYGNLVGVIIMTICLGVYMASYEFGKHIVEVEV